MTLQRLIGRVKVTVAEVGGNCILVDGDNVQESEITKDTVVKNYSINHAIPKGLTRK